MLVSTESVHPFSFQVLLQRSEARTAGALARLHRAFHGQMAEACHSPVGGSVRPASSSAQTAAAAQTPSILDLK